MKTKTTLEKFLRDKLESEIGQFGDGNTEFHTRDLEQLVNILDDKDDCIRELNNKIEFLTAQLELRKLANFRPLLEMCMTINNLTAEERLRCIRKEYKHLYENLKY